MSNAMAASSQPAAQPTELVDLLLQLAPALRELMGRDQLVLYVDGCTLIEPPAGVVLYREGDPVDAVLFVVDGHLKETRTQKGTTAPRDLVVRTAGAGGWLGLFDLFFRHAHTTQATTATPCRLVRMPASQISRLLYRFPALRGALMPEDVANRLRTIPLLAGLDSVSLTYLAAAILVRPAAAGEVLYQAGDDSAYVYFINRGQVQLAHEDGRQMWLGSGCEFGYGERSSANPEAAYPLDHNAVASCSSDLYMVRRAQFYAITGIHIEPAGWELRSRRIHTLEQLTFFRNWQPEPLKQLLGYMSHAVLPVGHLITQQGEPADSMWILMPGAGALIHALNAAGDAESETRIAGANLFNEEVLLAPGAAASTIEAEPDSQWLRLHWRDYEAYLQQEGQNDQVARLRAVHNPPPPQTPKQRRRFPWLDLGEKVVLEARRHWIDLLVKLVPAVLLTIVALVLIAGLSATGNRADALSADGGGSVTLGVRVLLWLTVLSAVIAWLWGISDYRNDYLVVTTQRVMHQEKVLFLKHYSAWTPLESVQDISIKNGFWGNQLGFADVEVQTPGASSNIRFDRAARFNLVKKAIHAERARRAQYHHSIGKREIHETLASRFGVSVVLPERVWMGQVSPLDPSARLARKRRLRAAVAAASAESPQRIVWRQHWLILLRNIIGQVALLVGIFVLALWLAFAGEGQPRFSSLHSLSLLAAMLVVLWILWSIEDWRIDEYILDKDQVVDKLATPLGLKSEQRVAQVTDLVEINFAQPTPVHIFFNFGSVFLQTAAAEGQFTFYNIPDPQGVTELIRKRRDEARQTLEHKKALQRAEELPDWLEIYTRLQPGRPE